MAYRKVTRFISAADGTRIAYHTHLSEELDEAREEELRSRPAVLLTNGIGTSENFWRYLVEALCRDYRVVHWDYRGHGSSDVASSGDYSIETQADDLKRVTEAVIARGTPPRPPLHVAFSMGVTVFLEMYRRHAELVPAVALIAGAPDGPGRGIRPDLAPGFKYALEAMLTAAEPVVPLVGPAVQRLLTSGLAYPVGRAIGMLRERAPKPDIDEFMWALRGMDPVAYWRTLKALMTAKTSDVLPMLKVPVLVIAAAHDFLVPEREVERMKEHIPHARWLRVADAGHAGLLEAGPEVAVALVGFLREAAQTQENGG